MNRTQQQTNYFSEELLNTCIGIFFNLRAGQHNLFSYFTTKENTLFIYLVIYFFGGGDFLRTSLKYLMVQRKGENKKKFCFHYQFESL